MKFAGCRLFPHLSEYQRQTQPSGCLTWESLYSASTVFPSSSSSSLSFLLFSISISSRFLSHYATETAKSTSLDKRREEQNVLIGSLTGTQRGLAVVLACTAESERGRHLWLCYLSRCCNLLLLAVLKVNAVSKDFGDYDPLCWGSVIWWCTAKSPKGSSTSCFIF